MRVEKTVAFYTLGCKLNFTETSTIAREFIDEGYQKVDFEASPDVYVINTCSVTDAANKKCRNIVNRARRTKSTSIGGPPIMAQASAGDLRVSVDIGR